LVESRRACPLGGREEVKEEAVGRGETEMKRLGGVDLREKR
jgi:hypothetical protein